MVEDLGGDPPCWAHLVEDEDPTDRFASVIVHDVEVREFAGADGVLWNLPHGGDLDANVVRLGPGAEIEQHVNREVDVLLYVIGGRGELTMEERRLELEPTTLALIPVGVARAIHALEHGMTYLSIHRRRERLPIGRRRKSGTAEN